MVPTILRPRRPQSGAELVVPFACQRLVATPRGGRRLLASSGRLQIAAEAHQAHVVFFAVFAEKLIEILNQPIAEA